MVESIKSTFLSTLIITVIIFVIGLVIGFAIEGSRVDRTELALLNSEINLLDEQVRSRNIGAFNLSCGARVQSTFDFADRIYEEARTLERYDASSKFTEELRIIHKKYDLLRTLLWTHSIEIRDECSTSYHTVVYLFDYASEDFDQKARQAAFSRVLEDLKEDYGRSILLVPIAANLELESVDMIKERFGVAKGPAIIIDEEKVITEDVTLTELEDIIFEQNNYEVYEGVLYEVASSGGGEKIMLNVNK